MKRITKLSIILVFVVCIFAAAGYLQGASKKSIVGQIDDPALHKALLEWRMNKNYITYYGTEWDPTRGTSTITGLPFRDHKLIPENPVTKIKYPRSITMYCAFPMAEFLPRNLMKYWNHVTPTQDPEGKQIVGGVNLVSYVVGRYYYMEVTRLTPPESDLDPQPESDKVYAIIDDRGPDYAGTLDCSPAVLRTLGVKSIKIKDRNMNSKDLDNRVSARLVPKDRFMSGEYDAAFKFQKIIYPVRREEINVNQ